MFKAVNLRRQERESIIRACKYFGVEVPKFARTDMLDSLYKEFLHNAILAKTKDGIELKRIDEEGQVKEFCFFLDLSLDISVKAESKEVAEEWLQEEISSIFAYKPYFEVYNEELHDMHYYDPEDDN